MLPPLHLSLSPLVTTSLFPIYVSLLRFCNINLFYLLDFTCKSLEYLSFSDLFHSLNLEAITCSIQGFNCCFLTRNIEKGV